MEYLNTAVRSNASAIAYRLSAENASEQAHLRIQTGYFTLNGLAGLRANIDHLALNNLPITIALGANDKATIKPDVDALFTWIGCPRPLAKLCVVSCVGGLFHPKVVHLTRTDGSQLAYVGSANVTPSGFNGANIEAGILLDSRSGDPKNILDEIAASIDEWFNGTKTGVTAILGVATTTQLVADGILGIIKTPVSTGASSGAGSTTPKLPLGPLVSFPLLSSSGSAVPSPGSSSPISSKAAAPAVAAPVAVAPVVQDILVAQIGSGPRWKQANFPYSIVQNFFGMNPTGNGFVDLLPVAASGSATAAVPTKVVNVQSQNYRLELNSVSGLPYPTTGRPIAVFRRIAGGTFRYKVFFPGDPGYSALDAGLAGLYTGPTHQLKRVIINSAALTAIWSACPV